MNDIQNTSESKSWAFTTTVISYLGKFKCVSIGHYLNMTKNYYIIVYAKQVNMLILMITVFGYGEY